MIARSPDASEIRRYLLRELPEPERARLEESYFSDDSLLDLVEAQEDQLVSEYVMGRLPDAEKRRFEESLLASPYYRERVETTTRLRRRIVKDRSFRRLLLGSSTSRSAAQRTPFFPGRTGTVVAFALLFTLLVAALVSATRLKGQLEAARKAPQVTEPVLVLLSPPDPGTAARTVVRPRGAALLIGLPSTLASKGPVTGALLAAGGLPAWQGTARLSGGGDPVLTVPAGSPAPGRYEVRVTAGSEATTAGTLDLVEPSGR